MTMAGLWLGLCLAVVGARDTQPPQIVSDRLNREVELKTGSINRFVLECKAVAEPPPTYTWYRDGVELGEVEGVKRTEDSERSQLDFFSPQSDHAGSYYCEAANSVGRARSAQSRVVLSPSLPPPDTATPTFTRAPQTEVQTLGSRVELRCEAEGSPQPHIVWLKNGEEVATGDRLVIPSLSQRDVANYACNASNVAGYEYKNVIVNILTVAARIKEGPKELLVASKGKDVVLPCRAAGFPVPVIQWSKDGEVVEEGQGEKYRLDSGFLKILKAGDTDQGNYTCTASNHGSDSVTGRLLVQGKTKIVTGPTDRTEPVQREVVELECDVVGDLSDGQTLTVIWKKDGKDLGSPGFPLSDRVEQAANHSLYLHKLAFSDSGTYTCVGGTGIGDLVTMSGMLTVAGLAPSLVLGQQAGRLEGDTLTVDKWEGEPVTVDCRLEQGLTDEGTPRIYWYKDGERVGREGDRSTASIQQGGERLVIERAEMKHSGLWVCKAENSEGDDSKAVRLAVRRRTALSREPQDMVLEPGARAVFQCVAVADPSLQRELSVVWNRDGKRVVTDCAYLCGDGVTCLHAEELCNGVADCPMHEAGQGEDEQECDLGSGDYEEEEPHPCDLNVGHKFVMSDHSLVLCSPTEADLGSYSCLVSSPMEQAIASQSAQLYLHPVFPWWILVLIFIVLLLLLGLCVFTFCWRRRKTGKGYYNPMDPENLKHNKSDIYYTTEDADSIMQESDTSGEDGMQPSQPATYQVRSVFTPKTLRQLSGSNGGSLGSLMEDDEFLNRGMNEDGSFRERYAE